MQKAKACLRGAFIKLRWACKNLREFKGQQSEKRLTQAALEWVDDMSKKLESEEVSGDEKKWMKFYRLRMLRLIKEAIHLSELIYT